MVNLEESVLHEIDQFVLKAGMPLMDIGERFRNFSERWGIHVKSRSDVEILKYKPTEMLYPQDSLVIYYPSAMEYNNLVKTTIATKLLGKNVYYFNSAYMDEGEILNLVSKALTDIQTEATSRFVRRFLPDMAYDLRAKKHLSQRQLQTLEKLISPEGRQQDSQQWVQFNEDQRLEEITQYTSEGIASLKQDAERNIRAYCNEMRLGELVNYAIEQMVGSGLPSMQVPYHIRGSNPPTARLESRQIHLFHYGAYLELIIERFAEMSKLVRENRDKGVKGVERNLDPREFQTLADELLIESYNLGMYNLYGKGASKLYPTKVVPHFVSGGLVNPR